MSLKSFMFSSLSIASLVLGVASTASAEYLVPVYADNGTVYQIDLDNRKADTTSTGWRHVSFWLSTRGETNKYRAIASCAPYDLQAPHYNIYWRPNGGGYPTGTVAGDISRVACGD